MMTSPEPIDIDINAKNKPNYLIDSDEYNTLISLYNESINDFVTKYSNLVKIESSNDGYTYITLEYGTTRNPILKEIANRVINTTNDEDFKIGDIRCSIIYASNLILKFKGKTTEVIADLQDSEKTIGIEKLVTKSKVNVTIPYELPDDIESLFKSIITKKSNFDESFLKSCGLKYYIFGGSGHLGIDVSSFNTYFLKTYGKIIPRNPDDLVDKVDEENIPITKRIVKNTNYIIKSIQNILIENPKLITTELNDKLSKKNISLERIDSNFIMFKYKLNIYDEKKSLGKIIKTLRLYVSKATIFDEFADGGNITDYLTCQMSERKQLLEIDIPCEISKRTTISDIRNIIRNNFFNIKEQICSNYSNMDGDFSIRFNSEDLPYDGEGEDDEETWSQNVPLSYITDFDGKANNFSDIPNNILINNFVNSFHIISNDYRYSNFNDEINHTTNLGLLSNEIDFSTKFFENLDDESLCKHIIIDEIENSDTIKLGLMLDDENSRIRFNQYK